LHICNTGFTFVLRGFCAFMAKAPLDATLHFTAIRHILSALFNCTEQTKAMQAD